VKSEPNFVEKLCVENMLRETKLCVTNQSLPTDQVCAKIETRKPNFV